jgi:TfoX/Sxy family transcriptional regulator of competence genes
MAIKGSFQSQNRQMMGGLCFMVEGHMALGIVGEELMVRVGADGHKRTLERVHAREIADR